MATALYLEHYLDSLETLPQDIKRNFNLMRDLDTRSQELLQDIDSKADYYLHNVKDMAPESRTEHLAAIQKLFSKSQDFGHDKVNLATATYELVDKNIRKLDADLARFEAELKDKNVNNSSEKENKAAKGSGKNTGKNEKKSKKKKLVTSDSEDDTPVKKKKGRKSQPAEPEVDPPPVTGIPPLLSIAHPADVLDMPVDPNEPTYCLCHQVSYGEMIGCDNQDCPIEWFHFACVNLTVKPKGKWYCPRCFVERKKK